MIVPKVPSVGHYREMLIIRIPAASVPILDIRVSFDLREHHCLDDNPLSPGHADLLGNDVLNAWIPRGALIRPTAAASA